MIKLKKKCLSEIEEEMCSMKMNKDSFRRFHQYMDQLPENEKQKRIEIRKFFVPDEISVDDLLDLLHFIPDLIPTSIKKNVISIL